MKVDGIWASTEYTMVGPNESNQQTTNELDVNQPRESFNEKTLAQVI